MRGAHSVAGQRSRPSPAYRTFAGKVRRESSASPLDALRNWEQGRRQPDVCARAFLVVIDREPEAVRRALAMPDDLRARRVRDRQRAAANSLQRLSA